mmetsp:Transcript_22144/g.59274  ORF Transcript_22144/g.59274 Transcript_22144/m.59274 type:complete len:407 (+) Transcript_22144:133-1353(+)
MLGIVLELRVGRYQGVLRSDVQVVVETPVHGPNSSSGVPEALEEILEHLCRPQRYAEAVDGVEHRHDEVRRRLKDVRPHVVHQVLQRVLAAKALDAQRQVLDRPRGRLPVDQVPIHERVLEDGGDGVDVVLAHLADVLEHEAQALEDTVLHVQLRHAVLVHQRGQYREGATRLGNDGDGHCGADAQLTLLNLEIVQQGAEHIVRSNGLGDVPKCVHGGSTDRLFVGLQQLEQVEADAVPLARGRELGAAVGDPSHQVDAVLLHLLVPILEDRGQARQQVLDGRGHLGHADHVHDGFQGTQDGTQHLRILLPQVFVQEETQVPHHLLLPALLHHHRNACNEVRSLLAHASRGCVQAPPDDTRNLRQVRLDTGSKRVHNCAEAVEHDGSIIGSLLLERVDNTVDDLLL